MQINSDEETPGMMQHDALRMVDSGGGHPSRAFRNTALPAIYAAFGLLVLSAASVEAAQKNKCRPGLAQYKALKTGMGMAAVARKLGCAGKKVSRLRIGKNDRATYSWRGKGTYGANLNVTFRNGALASKSQLGLE